MLQRRMPGRLMGSVCLIGGPVIDVKNLFNIDFETGDLSQFDSTVDPDADLSVGAAGAMGGTANGLSVIIDDVNPTYGAKNIVSPASGKLRIRFYFDPNGLTIGAGDNFLIARWFDSSGSFLYGWAFELSQANWQTKVHYCIDGGYGGQQAGGALSDAPHYIEIYIQRSSSALASDGRIDWWIDGGAETAIVGIDNFDLWDTMDVGLWGAVADMDPGTSGTMFFDEIAGNDNGEEIGA